MKKEQKSLRGNERLTQKYNADKIKTLLSVARMILLLLFLDFELYIYCSFFYKQKFNPSLTCFIESLDNNKAKLNV